jgi:hypothetical protein
MQAREIPTFPNGCQQSFLFSCLGINIKGMSHFFMTLPSFGFDN